MSLRTMAATVTVVVLMTPLAGNAAPVGLNPSAVQTSHGSIVIDRTSFPESSEADTTVTFDGLVAGRGWTYTGVLSGVARAYTYETFTNNIPNFHVASPDGSVAGDCAAGFRQPVNPHFTFDCVLSRDGGMPWQLTIKTRLPQTTTDGNSTTWSGNYRARDVSASLVEINHDVSYGDVQFMDYTDAGGGVQFGPLRLSGQIMIGSVRWRGDLVGAKTDYLVPPISEIPSMALTGTGSAGAVTGSCTGTLDASLFTCDLAVDGGTSATVRLRTHFTGGGGRCSGRACYSDSSGYFISDVDATGV